MNERELINRWKQEESIAHISGWDFSHINGRYEEGENIPWDYDAIVRLFLKPDMKLMDYDTGGGEYLLSLQHPYENTAATEGYPPNVELCRKKLIPLGIDLRECADAAHIPFEDRSFDIVINRHGDFEPKELKRILKPGGRLVLVVPGKRHLYGLKQAVYDRPYENDEALPRTERLRLLDTDIGAAFRFTLEFAGEPEHESGDLTET